MSVDIYTKRVIIPPSNEGIYVYDGHQHMEYFDLSVSVVSRGVFTGTIDICFGGLTVESKSYSNEAVQFLCPVSDKIGMELLPPTAGKVFGPPVDILVCYVVFKNTGLSDTVFDVSFMRKHR